MRKAIKDDLLTRVDEGKIDEITNIVTKKIDECFDEADILNEKFDNKMTADDIWTIIAARVVDYFD